MTIGAGLIGSFIVAVTFGSVWMAHEDAKNPYRHHRIVGDKYSLDSDEIERLTGRANAGDIDAAIALSQHYFIGSGSSLQNASELSQNWQQRAAESGDLQSQEALVNVYSGRIFETNPERALRWMEQAAAKDWPGARYALKEMRNAPPPTPPKEELPFDERGYRR